MAREVLYRRSFHLERDSKGVENLFELDTAPATRNGASDAKTFAADGGFQAPRNSLDVPFSGLLGARMNSEVRCEEIPIGYELSRSLTSRRTKEGFPYFEPLTSASNEDCSRSRDNLDPVCLELGSKPEPRARSVVARLMGLDTLPGREALQGPHHPSPTKVSQEECLSYRASADYEENVGVYSKEEVMDEELSFQNHPQQKQLQEFKRDFAARQVLQERPPISRLNFERRPLPPEEREQSSRTNPQINSEEFLEALDFLNANKDFFVGILNDPHSSFAKHLQQGGVCLPSIGDGTKQHVGAKLSKCSFEHTLHSSTRVSKEGRNSQELHQVGPIDKARAIGNLRWGRDDEMPGRLRWRTSTMRPAGRGDDQVLPSRIVVLKPNLGRQPNENSYCPSIHHDGIFHYRKNDKEKVKPEMKFKENVRNGGLAREFFRDDLREGPYDARAIAKRIVKHVKEDMRQRSSNDDKHLLQSAGRRILAQRLEAWHADVSRAVDGEVFQRATKRTSLPSSPHVWKSDRETEQPHSSFNEKRGSQMEETRKGSYKQPTLASKSFKESSKVDEVIMHDSQGLCKKEIGEDSKASKKICRSNSSKVRDSKCEAPRVLPRSLSAPAAPCKTNRYLENESRDGHSFERATRSSRAKSSENSIFKERLLSFKDSFSLLSKKVSGKKLSPTQSNLPLDSNEVSTSRHIDGEPVDVNVDCTSLLGPSAVTKADAKEVKKWNMKTISESRMTTLEFPQWTLSRDIAGTVSESSLDTCEQPSPQSVLEISFQEESPSSEDTKGKEFKHRDILGGLSHLEVDRKEQTQNLHGAFCYRPMSRRLSFDSPLDESLDTRTLLEAHLQSVGLFGFACPSGGKEKFAYVAHVLRLSGITEKGFISAHSLSPEHGLNRSNFGKLEAYYTSRYLKEASLLKKDGQTSLDSSSRRLLFDVADEVISNAAKKCLLQPWWIMPSSQRIFVCTGKQLLERICTHINYDQGMQCGVEEETFEDMVSKDWMREGTWVHSQSDMESVVIELERLLCCDIIRELVHNLRR